MNKNSTEDSNIKSKKFSRTPSKLQEYIKNDLKTTQEKIAQKTFQSVRTVSQVCRSGEGTNASKELIRLHLGMTPELFYSLLDQPLPKSNQK